jgi:hypothetical protein
MKVIRVNFISRNCDWEVCSCKEDFAEITQAAEYVATEKFNMANRERLEKIKAYKDPRYDMQEFRQVEKISVSPFDLDDKIAEVTERLESELQEKEAAFAAKRKKERSEFRACREREERELLGKLKAKYEGGSK